MIRLIVCYYKDKNKERDKENTQAITNNINCKAIDEIILVLEGNSNFNSSVNEKVKTIYIENRPTFNSIIKLGNSLANDDDLTLFCNTDIYFDETIKLSKSLKMNEIFALSRYELKDGNAQLFARYDSQDAWIFKGKIPTDNIGDFYFGIPSCDNVLVHELTVAGITVSNPCFSIKCYHLHKSDFRDYHTSKTMVKGSRKYLIPTSLNTSLSKKETLTQRDVLYDYYSYLLTEGNSNFQKTIYLLKKIYYYKWRRHLYKTLFNKPMINYSAH